jgi:hypothetical protein
MVENNHCDMEITSMRGPRAHLHNFIIACEIKLIHNILHKTPKLQTSVSLEFLCVLGSLLDKHVNCSIVRSTDNKKNRSYPVSTVRHNDI